MKWREPAVTNEALEFSPHLTRNLPRLTDLMRNFVTNQAVSLASM